MLNLPVVLMGLGLVAGLAGGGNLRRFFQTDFRGFWLIPLGLGSQGALEVLSLGDLQGARSIAPAVITFSYAALILFTWLNRTLPGMWLAGMGLALNLLAIAANGAMPVSEQAARVAGIDLDVVLLRAVRHELLGTESRLVLLSDVIPLPGLRTVISAGDCLIGAGLFRFMDRLVRYEPRRLA